MSKNKNSFFEGPILPTLMKFALPILLTLFIQALYGAVDLWAVGRFAEAADISAVSTGSQTMFIITGTITGLSMGVTILLGQLMGNQDKKGCANTFCTSIEIFIILGICLTILMMIFAPNIAILMNAPETALKKTTDYILICSCGTLFIVGYNLLSGIFKGLGNSKEPLLFATIACIFNIIGDVVLIKFFHLGTIGAAIATISAQAISVILSIRIVKKTLPFNVSKENWKFNKKYGKQIIKLGSPIAFQDMCNELSFLIIIGIVNNLGVTSSAGVGIAERLVMFILLIPMAYMSSISAYVAQNIGAKKYKRAEKSMWLGMATATFFGGVISYISFFHGDLLSSIFSSDTEVIMKSAEFLKATAIECFLLSIAYCFTGYFNGLGKTTFVMAQGLCAIALVRIPFAYYMGTRPSPKLFNIGLSATFAALFTLSVCIIYFIIHKIKMKEKSN